jgi:dienelactone hydrolase
MKLFVSSRLQAMFRGKFFSVTSVALALVLSNVFAVASAFQTFQFKSEVTGKRDSYAWQKPYAQQEGVQGTLLVYFHGLGQDFREPFTVMVGTTRSATMADAILMEEASVAILSCNYGTASWGRTAALNDITKNIRDVLQAYPAFRIVLFGTSMGAGTAINYAALAPEDIKKKVTGVLAVYPCGNLKDLLDKSHNPAVKPSLLAAFGEPNNNNKEWDEASCLTNIKLIDKHVKVCVITSISDDVVPPEFQRAIVKALKKNGNKVKYTLVEGNHAVPPRTPLLSGLAYALHPGIK